MQYVDIMHLLKNRDTAERLRVAKHEHKIVDPICYSMLNNKQNYCCLHMTVSIG